MMRALPDSLLLATGNAEKLSEWQSLLADAPVTLRWQALPEVEEDAPDYEGNAALKALAAARHTGLVALGDDSGLEVDALMGAPGLLTRRWAMERGGWQAARQALAAYAGSRARFFCGLALAWPEGPALTALGSTEGTIVPPSAAGVGLEPCFLPDGSERPLPMLAGEERQRLHYRARAWQALLARLAQAG